MAALINIDVDNLERAVAFYTAGLGLTPGRKLGPDIVELLGAGVPIYLLRKAAGSVAASTINDRRHYGRHWTPVHLDFVVTELDAAVEARPCSGRNSGGACRDPCVGSDCPSVRSLRPRALPRAVPRTRI